MKDHLFSVFNMLFMRIAKEDRQDFILEMLRSNPLPAFGYFNSVVLHRAGTLFLSGRLLPQRLCDPVFPDFLSGANPCDLDPQVPHPQRCAASSAIPTLWGGTAARNSCLFCRACPWTARAASLPGYLQRCGAVEVDGLRVTVSGGVCEYRGETIRALIHTVDERLYRAKSHGKNHFISS